MTQTENTTEAPMPLLYRKPEALSAERHGSLSLKAAADFSFARNTNAVPITDVEFAVASRTFPIVFSASPVTPLAVLGLQKDNIFVDNDGKWIDTSAYVPAYLRRYPFVFIEHDGNYTLGLDRACERLVEAGGKEEAGEAFFVDGKPSAFTRDALGFAAQLQNQHRSSRAFGEALAEQGLLIDREARATLPDGRHYNVNGFKIVDAQKFQAVPDAVVVEWHRKGWLGLVHFHLASLENWGGLLTRQGAVPAAA
jgi:hypothetical protein